jgi:hypothetical protein
MAGTTSNNITVTSQGTTSTPIVKSVMQPTIVMNYIIKREALHLRQEAAVAA